jgi:hypothetical protein|tara:strand:+ start:715 stop:834 length:120 start_codon:yes stop_codon:yes gene_type:complete
MLGSINLILSQVYCGRFLNIELGIYLSTESGWIDEKNKL